MPNTTQPKTNWKQFLINEFIQLGIINLYFAISFSVLITLNSLALAQHGIDSFNYGVAIFGALFLGKIILLLEHWSFVKRYDHQPLLYTVLYKSLLFTLLVFVVNILEYYIFGFFQGKSVSIINQKIINEVYSIAFISKNLSIFVVFIPFFSIRELNKILGKDKLKNLFFKSRQSP